jgi:two-component SAPR family response regulator
VTTTSIGRSNNLAFFVTRQKSLFGMFAAATARSLPVTHVAAVVLDDRVAATARGAIQRHDRSTQYECKRFDQLGFLKVPISFREIARRLHDWLAPVAADKRNRVVLAVDMSWGLQTNSAAANFETWMAVAEDLSSRLSVSVISLYNRKLLIDEQMLAAVRGHPGILTSTGVIANPHWLPAHLLNHGTLRQQIDHLLRTTVPELDDIPAAAEHAAEGTDPMWLLRRSADEPVATHTESRDRWKIRCFGRLRIYRSDGSQVDWEVSGGATRKTKTLFAYLMQKGGEGASTDELADLLWPDSKSSEAARNRLYHTVKCLRGALQLATLRDDNTRRYLLRDGSRYVLAPPERSWLDISTFEQLCRQSQNHIKSNASDEALICLQAADRLYTGDLFQDIPSEYTDNSERDWCWSRRYWLRDMFFKVQRDAARIYRERRDYSAALIHCQKALSIDPLCEIAHEEAMHVFHAQGRRDAIDRQYKLYLKSLTHFDDRPQSGALRRTYQDLASQPS